MEVKAAEAEARKEKKRAEEAAVEEEEKEARRKARREKKEKKRAEMAAAPGSLINTTMKTRIRKKTRSCSQGSVAAAAHENDNYQGLQMIDQPRQSVKRTSQPHIIINRPGQSIIQSSPSSRAVHRP